MADAEELPTAASADAEQPEEAEQLLHYDNYKDYTLQMFQALDAKSMKQRSIVPQRSVVPTKELRKGKDGALHH